MQQQKLVATISNFEQSFRQDTETKENRIENVKFDRVGFYNHLTTL